MDGRARGVGLLIGLSVAGGCVTMPLRGDCPQGQQWHEGHCVPTSTLVFERCLESFRKSKTARDHGVDTELSAQVKGQGGSLRHERQDHEEAEYDGLPEELMADAIGECRRQEEQQRSLELERAWAAAQEADRRARQAESRAEQAERERERSEQDSERVAAAMADLEGELELAREQLASGAADLEALRATLVDRHPCTAQAWDRCGEQALVAKRDGDYTRAHELYRQACGGGSAEACGNWGVMFEHGLGVLVDLPQAHGLYEQACEGGSDHACVNLGYLYEQGRGVSRDLDRAAALYDQACDDGQMRGCGRLGRLVDLGVIDEEGFGSAAELLGRACDADYPRACLWAGLREVEGRDGERRAEQAARRFARACEREVPEACVQLGRLHELGDGVREDPGEAATLYRKACEAGDPRGCAAVERMSRGAEQERNGELAARR